MIHGTTTMRRRYVATKRSYRRRSFTGFKKRKSYTGRSRSAPARKRRRVARDFAPAVPGMKNTKTVWLTHRMMQAFNLTNSSAGANHVEFIIKANSPRDPDIALSGASPAIGFDYYASIYTKYRCTESTQQVKFCTTGQGGYASGVALIVHDLAHEDETNGLVPIAGTGSDGAVGGFLLSTLKPGATHRMVTTGMGKPVTLFRRYNSRAAFGVTPTTGADEALTTADPTRTALYKVLVANQGFDASTAMATTPPFLTGTVMITTRYKVKFLSPRDLTSIM